MKRAKVAPVDDPLQLLDASQPTPSVHALHVVKDPSRLHSNVVAFVKKVFGSAAVELVPREPGLYLSFPEETPDTKAQLASWLPAASAQRVDAVLHSLCEPATLVVVESLLLRSETNAELMARLGSLSPVEQLAAVWAPVQAAGLSTVPCELPDPWQHSKALWCSNYLPGVATLRHLAADLDALPLGAILLGHESFALPALVARFRELPQYPHAVLPMYVVNFLQDEQVSAGGRVHEDVFNSPPALRVARVGAGGIAAYEHAAARGCQRRVPQVVR